MDYKTFFDVFSLYEFAAYFIFFVLSVATNNLYFLVLFLALWTKQIPEKFFKLVISGDINQRPSNAFNCNMINKGGDASTKSGFPSGHCTISSMIATYLVYVFVSVKDKTIKLRVTQLMILSIIFAILMPIVRYMNNCHTNVQVFGGFFNGIIWGIIFVLFEKYVLDKWSLYVKHRNKIWT